MDCDIVLVGLNHRTAGVDVRERFALVDFCSRENWALPCDDVIGEAMILSTCNRVELLATGHGDVAGRILERWATARGTDPEELRPYVYIYKNMDAVRHLFSVASSLDSMILGEPQILGQLKSAYRKAAACHATGVILNRLLHKAFSVAKRVRTETAVASSAVSISYAAVELAKRIFGEMQHHKAMLVGAGEKVYEGMVIGYTASGEDVDVNVCKTKHLTNTRASGSDDALRLIPISKLSLEGCLEFLAQDELLEVTPENLRIRKQILNHEQRMKAKSKLK